jgi:hypothetical protein
VAGARYRWILAGEGRNGFGATTAGRIMERLITCRRKPRKAVRGPTDIYSSAWCL